MRRTRHVLLALAVLLAAPAAASAQDFLFGAPRGSFGLRLGANLASAGSEIFDFSRDRLTLDRGDFHSVLFAGELGLAAHERVDVVLGLAYSQAEARSEFRDYVDLDDLPIEQETRYGQVPVTVSLKAYPLARGRSVGRLAWVPAAVSPYVGLGGGAVRYTFEQTGDFVDELDPELPIFTDRFTSSGWAPLLHGFAGADFALSPRTRVSVEARYSRASSELDGDFIGFDDIDLSGLQTTLGIAWRF